MIAQRRNPSVDLLRSISAVAVVAYHVLGCCIDLDPGLSEQAQKVFSAFFEALSWHVPTFFLITGYLWLNDGKACTFAKMAHNIRRFVAVLFTVGFAFSIMERLFVAKRLCASLLLSGMTDVLTGNLWAHMWYLYSIVGVYLFLPVIKPFFHQSSKQTIGFLVGLLFVFTILEPVVDDFGGSIPVRFPITKPAFYVCAGGFIAKGFPASRRTAILSAALFCCSFASTLLIQYFVPELEALVPLLTCISAVSIFLSVIRGGAQMHGSSALKVFSRCTFGIYLFHPFFLNLMFKLLHLYPSRFPLLVSIPVVCAAATLSSFALTYFLKKIRWINRAL